MAAQSTSSNSMSMRSSFTTKDKSEKNLRKGRKKRLASSKATEELEELVAVRSTNPFEIAGVMKIVMSPITQKIIGCVVGDDVTAEEPWTYVKKEKLEDNIDLHEDSSEFLPIASQIQNYPEKEILVGWIPAGSKKDDYFYVIVSLEAKEEVLKTVEKQNSDMQERLKRSVLRPVKKWKSLGSETEVNLSLIQSFRPLIEVEVESKFPLFDQTIHFKQRNVEDARDGYVELLPDPRYPITNVTKKRIDVGVQASLLKVTTEVQTIPPFPKNQHTQYAYLTDIEEYHKKEKVKEKVIPQKQIQQVITFTPEKIDAFLETLYFNSNVDLYKDDYELLLPQEVKRQKVDTSATLRHFLSLTEVKTTRHNVACDASWYNFKSGLIAVCYASYSFSDLSYGPEAIDEVDSAFEGATPVLIWSYDDGLKPKLYLQSPRDVTFLSFCPYKENLLVGGCRNGQIIVWDITNKLEQVETHEILQYSQHRNRMNLMSLMKWMKYTHNIAEVQPVLISSLKESHTKTVTALRWIHPGMEFTKNGKVVVKENPSKKTLGFMSLSIDGTILVWDLTVEPPEDLLQKTKRKVKRIEKLPSALTIVDSDYKKLQTVFKPYFKIIVKDGNDLLPIVAVVRKPNIHKYVPLGATNPHPTVRNEYELGPVPWEPEQYPLFVTTSNGSIYRLKWGGYDFAPGQKLNTEEATIIQYQSIHDGPIVSCHIHPEYDEFFMTVGGTVFSVWSIELTIPLFWRKAHTGTKYMSAAWTYENPSYLNIVRSDGAFEIWDLSYSNKKPLRIVHLGGDLKTNVMGALSGMHVRKGTFAVTDTIGSLTLFHLPPIVDVQRKGQLQQTRDLLRTSTRRKKYLMGWIEQFEEKFYGKKQDSAKQLVVSVSETKVEKKAKPLVGKLKEIFVEVAWDKNVMAKYEVLLSRKKLNIKELNQQRQPLLQMEKEKQARFVRLEKIFENKEKILETTFSNILIGKEHMRKRIYSVFELDNFSYVADYDELEQQMLWYIYSHPFEQVTNFSEVIEKGRRGQCMVNKRLKRTNIRKGRLPSTDTRKDSPEVQSVSPQLSGSHIEKSTTSTVNVSNEDITS